MRIAGNSLLVLVTLAVAALAGYLVLYPPGMITASSAGQVVPTLPLVTTATTPSATTTTPPPPPAQLTMEAACAAVLPVMDRVASLTVSANGPDGGNVDVAGGITSDLGAIKDLSPDELATTIEPLLTVLTDYTNALRSQTAAQLDTATGSASEQAVRDLCAAG